MMQERLVREVDVFAATKRKVQNGGAAKREAKKETEGKKLGKGGRVHLGMGLAVLDRAVDPPDHVDVLVLVVFQKVVCLPARGARGISLQKTSKTAPIKNRSTHEELTVGRPRVGLFPQALGDEILRRRRVRVGQRGRVAVHDRRQLGKHVLVRLGRVRVVPARGFDHRQAERPHVGRGRVRRRRALRFALDPFRLQVARTVRSTCVSYSVVGFDTEEQYSSSRRAHSPPCRTGTQCWSWRGTGRAGPTRQSRTA